MTTDISDPRIRCIAHVSREYSGLAGAGGIKDVTEGLARAAASAGIETHVFLPFYRAIDATIPVTDGPSFDIQMNYASTDRTEHARIRNYSPHTNLNLQVHLVDSDRFKYLQEGNGQIERQGIYTYTETEAAALGKPDLKGKGYSDYFAMNVLLVKATLHYLAKENTRPDIIHCHDGHASLLPLIAQESKDRVSGRDVFPPFLRYTPTLTTVHNAGQGHHQEVGDLDFAAAMCGVSLDIVQACLLGNQFDPLIVGGLFGSAINTVSESYARELQHTGQDWMTGWLGHALAGHGIELHGVTNGVDPDTFSPENPATLGIDHSFSPAKKEYDGKELCKENLVNLLARQSFPSSVPATDIRDENGELKLHIRGLIQYHKNVPLLTFIGRFSRQKGFDILAESLKQLLTDDSQVHVLGLGSGDKDISKDLKNLAQTFRGRVCIVEGYSEALAKHVYVAGDFFLVPSMFEPCGLTDFYAQLVGNVPIVHRVGGLVKTLDGEFGYSYLGGVPELLVTLRRALAAYRQPGCPEIRTIQTQAVRNISDNFTWEKVLPKYLELYRYATAQTQPRLPYGA